MDFNFDALEGELAAGRPEVVPMSEADFLDIGRQLQELLRAGKHGDLDRVVAQVLWVKNPLRRLEGLVRKVVTLLRELVSRRHDMQEAEAQGCALLHVLLRLAFSPALDRITTAQQTATSAAAVRVALILREAGSDIEEPTARSACYTAKGFTAVLEVCWCIFPTAMQQHQEAQLAEELQGALGEAGHLVVHVCGRHGHGMWCRIASLWSQRQRPFQDLPLLQSCLGAIVWECSPPLGSQSQTARGVTESAMAMETGKPTLTLQQALCMQRELHAKFSKDDFMDRLLELEETHKLGSAKFIGARNKLFLEVQKPVLVKFGFEGSQKGVVQMLEAGSKWNSHPDYKRNVDRLNCLLGINAEGSDERDRRIQTAQKEKAAAKLQEATSASIEPTPESDPASPLARAELCFRRLLSRCGPEWDQGKLLQDLRPFLMSAVARGAFWLGAEQGLLTDLGQHLLGSRDWDLVDSGMQPRVPQLFLHSKTDKVVPPEVVKEHFELAQARENQSGDVTLAELQGPHMLLWESNRPGCERAMLRFLRQLGMAEG